MPETSRPSKGAISDEELHASFYESERYKDTPAERLARNLAQDDPNDGHTWEPEPGDWNRTGVCDLCGRDKAEHP